MSRRLSPKDISAARHEWEIYESMRKRGMIKNTDKITQEYHVVCGCGAPGCIFIRTNRKEEKEQ